MFTPTPLPKIPTFLFIGRLIRDKGIQEYLAACRIVKGNHRNVRCLLVGPYDTNPTAIKPEGLQEYIDDGTIEYFGEQLDVRPYINQCSVFVLPSYHEGTPKTVLEAMASGRAVITTDAPGCKETVDGTRNGYLVIPKDVNVLSEKMAYPAMHPELVEQMGNEGRRIAEVKFDVRHINNIILSIMNLVYEGAK